MREAIDKKEAGSFSVWDGVAGVKGRWLVFSIIDHCSRNPESERIVSSKSLYVEVVGLRFFQASAYVACANSSLL